MEANNGVNEQKSVQNYLIGKGAVSENGLDMSGLEQVLMNSETKLNENIKGRKYCAGDCPCGCPKVLSAAGYVVFSPIF